MGGLLFIGSMWIFLMIHKSDFVSDKFHFDELSGKI